MSRAVARRRSLPYSLDAEEARFPHAGRRKAFYRDRPRNFATLEEAGTYAAARATRRKRRQLVRLDVDFFSGLRTWTVRDTVVVQLHDDNTNRATERLALLNHIGHRLALAPSLNRMEREA